MKKAILAVCIITAVLCVIISLPPTKVTKSVLQKEETLPYVEGINRDALISHVYYEPTPDSIQVKVCLTHTIAKLTTMELLHKTSFNYTFNKMQDSICNRQLDVKIHSVGVHRNYFTKHNTHTEIIL